MSNKKRSPGRPAKYPPEFERDAVAMVLDEGRSIADVARSIRVIEGTLGNWVGKARRERSAGAGVTADERAENAGLRAENARLRMERDLLKRSSTFRHSQPSTYTFTSSATAQLAGSITAYSGADQTNPIDTWTTSTSSGQSVHSAPVATASGPARLVHAVHAVWAVNGTVTETPGTNIERSDINTTGAGPVSLATGDRILPTSGPSGASTTTSTAAGDDSTITILITPATITSGGGGGGGGVPGIVTTDFAWDRFDRLVSVTSPTETTSMIYFPGGQRAILKDAAGVHLYLGAMMERHATTGTSSTKRVYTVGAVMVGTATRDTGASTTTIDYLLGDSRGSTSLSVEAGTTTVEQQWYDPYGQIRGADQITSTTRGYIGQHHDPTTNLNYLNNRYMDTSVGVFLSVDPLVATTGQAYLYAAGNPTTLSDPDGLCPTYSPTQGVIDDGRGKCQGTSHVTPRQTCNGGLIPTSCLPKLLPERYKTLIGSGDGEKDPKVVQYGKEIESGERDLCHSQLLACANGLQPLQDIKNIAESSGVNTDDGDGTLGNGRRHVLVAALLTWKFGPERAREVLDAHENIVGGQLLEGQEFNDIRMTDLVNNELGIALGQEFRNEYGDPRPFAEHGFASMVATGYYTKQGLTALENAVLSEPKIIYFVGPG